MTGTLTLIVPGLAALPAGSPSSCAALARVAARGDRIAQPDDLARLAWRLATGRDEAPPVAAILRLTERQARDTRYWLCVDPVHLAAGTVSLALSPVEVSPVERSALAPALAGILDGSGRQFDAGVGDRWYLGLDVPPDLTFTAPDRAAGVDLADAMPSGRDAAFAARLLTEAQMVLHDHPVNVARERAGKAPANAVWFWGGGVLGDTDRDSGGQGRRLFSGPGLARATWQAVGEPVADLPPDPDGVIGSGDIVVAVDPVGPAAPAAAQASLDGWIRAGVDALTSGRLDSLTIAGDGMAVVADRRAMRRFWRRAGEWPWST